MSVSTDNSGELSHRVGSGVMLAGLLTLGLPLHPGAFLMLIGLGGSVLLWTQPARRRVSALLWSPMAAFLLTSLVSSWYAEDSQRALLTNLTWGPSLFLGWVMATRFRRADVARLAWVMTITGVLISCYLLLTAATHPGASTQAWLQTAAYKHLSVPNDLLFTAFLCFFSMYLLLTQAKATTKFFLFVIILLLLSSLVVYQTRSGLVLAIAGVLVMIGLRRPRHLLLAGMTCLGVFLVADGLIGFAMTHKLLAVSNLSVRLPVWQVAWQMFQDAPWFGHGPGSFSVLYPEYVQSLALPSWVAFDDRHMPWAHSLYLESLAERGIVASLALLALLILLARQLWVFQRQAIEPL